MKEAPPAVCEHCRLPLPRARERFCCTGCSFAHRLLGRSDEGAPDRMLARLVLSAFLAMGVMVFSLALYGMDAAVEEEAAIAMRGLFRLAALMLSAPVLVLLGLPLLDAVVAARRPLSAEVLVLCGVGAAWLVSTWSTLTDGPAVYFETATMVLVLVALGRWLDARTRTRARTSLAGLAAEREPLAARIGAGGAHGEEAVPVEALRVGDLIRVRPGETVPVDGRVRDGRSFVDRSLLTGEERGRAVAPGQEVLAGDRLVDGSIEVEATRVHGERLRDEIDRLLSESVASRPRLVRVVDRVAGLFLPVVVVIAAATLVFHLRAGAGPERALLHALSVVLIACPCALGLATPLAFWTALGEAWRRGVLVRGAEVMERLARVRRVFLDKTGTLTESELVLSEVRAREDGRFDEAALLSAAAALEAGSEHPVARAVRRAASARESLVVPRVEAFRALPGVGVEGTIDGVPWRLERLRCAADDPSADTRVGVLCDGEEVGELRLAARIRADATELVDQLTARGLAPTVLTGDGRAAGAALARELGVPVEAELLPARKAEVLARAGPTGTVFVGDGLNDAVALAAADVGVAVASASPRSLEAASVDLLRDDLRELPRLLDLARSAVWTARGNLVWAFAYNGVGLWLAAAGRLSPVFAAGAMVASSVAVVLNTQRLRGRAKRAAGSTTEERHAPRWAEAH